MNEPKKVPIVIVVPSGLGRSSSLVAFIVKFDFNKIWNCDCRTFDYICTLQLFIVGWECTEAAELQSLALLL